MYAYACVFRYRDPVSRQQNFFVEQRPGIRVPAAPYVDAFLGLLRAADELEHLLDADLRREHGISLRGYEVLLHLAAFSADGRLAMTALIRQAPLSQSRVSRLVAELERRDLVRRTGDERDARAVVVTLTEEGLRVLRQAQPTHHRGLTDGLFSRLNRQEAAELARLTTKLLQPLGTSPATDGCANVETGLGS
jgi:DNA-binding MarR family transcriptional regulator